MYYYICYQEGKENMKNNKINSDILDKKINENNIDSDSLTNIKTDEKQFLIPSGGTTNWLINCNERGYRSRGYEGKLISKINISSDFRIEIIDYTQPSGDYLKKQIAFFTSVTFYKKELDNYSIYAPSVYDRPYSIYYPYGTRFDEKILEKIGIALNILINFARDLRNTKRNENILKETREQQKQLIELFINGTNDKFAVEKITGCNIFVFKFIPNFVRVARFKKDFLPHFNEVEEDQKLLKKNIKL